MTLTWRFVADLLERMAWTFVQAYMGAWLATGGGWDGLFTVDNLKIAAVAAVMVVATAVVRKPIGNPDSVSVLPPQAQPPAPQPPETPASKTPDPPTPAYLVAAVYSQRLGAWSTVYLHPEISADEGTFVLTGDNREGLPVAEYRPDRTGTHTPVGPMEMSELGLRPKVPGAV